MNSNKSTDYCLGKLDNSTNKIACSSRKLSRVDDTNKFGYPVDSDGIYAIIFNPAEPVKIKSVEECGFWCTNKMTILFGTLGGILFLIVLFYVFWR